MNSREFAQRYLLEEVKLIEAAKVRLHLLSAMVHGIESAGALLDSLPFKAKGQGQKRFNLAIKTLFPEVYLQAMNELNLYSQLRSHISHCMLPAKTVSVHQNAEPHLVMVGKSMQFSLPTLFADYCKAMELLIEKIDSRELKNKRIVFDNLEKLVQN